MASGAMNEELPTFVVMTSKMPHRTNVQALSNRLWSSGFLSPEHAAVALRTGSDPVLLPQQPAGLDGEVRRAMIDGVNDLNRRLFERVGDPEINARIAQYEMAFRMQTSVPELTDFSNEPQSTWDLYGPKAKEPGTFAYNCLMARRLVERGVRFTQIFLRSWDQHSRLPKNIRLMAEDSDQPTYALITDLKRRGLLDDTLVIWGGEFGRTVLFAGRAQRGELRPRSSPALLQHVDGGRRREAGYHLRGDRRFFLQHRERSGAHPRPPRHHPPPLRPRSRTGSRSSSRGSTHRRAAGQNHRWHPGLTAN
jgi:hypothetical protein